MKKIFVLLAVSIVVYSSIEIYYYARINHLSFELQRLQKECTLLAQKPQQTQDHNTIYSLAQQRLGLQKIKAHQLKKVS